MMSRACNPVKASLVCVRRSACVPRSRCHAIARPDNFEPTPPEQSDEEDASHALPAKDVNPITGNPQTGKLIDVYFEIGSMLAVVAIAFLSWKNVQNVLQQTSAADQMREPASKQEWLAMDSKDVYGPCGGSQNADAAMDDILEGKPCTTAEYARLTPSAQARQ